MNLRTPSRRWSPPPPSSSPPAARSRAGRNRRRLRRRRLDHHDGQGQDGRGQERRRRRDQGRDARTASRCCRASPRTRLEKSTAESIAMKVKGVKTVRTRSSFARDPCSSRRTRRLIAARQRSARPSRAPGGFMRPRSPRRGRRAQRAAPIAPRRAGSDRRADAPRASAARRCPARGSRHAASSQREQAQRASRRPAIVHEPSIRASRPGIESKRRSRSRRAAAPRPAARLRARRRPTPKRDVSCSSSAWRSSSRSGLAQRSCSSTASAVVGQADQPLRLVDLRRHADRLERRRQRPRRRRRGSRGVGSAGIRLWQSRRRRRAAAASASAPRTRPARRSATRRASERDAVGVAWRRSALRHRRVGGLAAQQRLRMLLQVVGQHAQRPRGALQLEQRVLEVALHRRARVGDVAVEVLERGLGAAPASAAPRPAPSAPRA